jgi:hypothetical protein
MQAIQFNAIVNQEQVIRPPDGISLPEGRVEVTVRPAASEGDDLSWEDLDYVTVALKTTKQVVVQIEHRGKLQPMRHDLDEE